MGEIKYSFEIIRLQNELRRKDEQIERLNQERDNAIEDFMDFVSSGTANFAPFCANANNGCVDKRGWCINDKCTFPKYFIRYERE